MRRLLLAAALLPLVTQAMFYYPDAATSQLEHIIVDNWGAYASNFSSAITPCTRYVTEGDGPGTGKSGRTTAAQWMRVAFHDFITADIAKGTGGIDGSIGFETGRAENKGSAFNDSFTFWRPFVNEFVPMADLVALGTVMSVNLCGGNYIPFRSGRIDAVAADPTTGVPEPGTDLAETLELFERAGFDQAEAIELTACGHTLGSTHHSGFPEAADASTVSSNNTNGGINFDSTRGTFDWTVVHEYMTNTGSRGGALVTSFNISSRSDLRLYASDGNATLGMLHDKGPDGFLDVCVDRLGRMIDTVGGKILSGEKEYVRPMEVKPVNVTWDVNMETGRVALEGRVRVLLPSSPNDMNTTVSIAFANGYEETLKFEEEVGKSVFGETRFAPFSIDREKVVGSASFTITTAAGAVGAFAIRDDYFIVPSQTTISSSGGASSQVSVTVAVRDDVEMSNLSVRIATPITQPLTLGPRIEVTSVELEPVEKEGERENSPVVGFTLLRASVDVDERPVGAVSLRLVRGGGAEEEKETLDTLLLGAEVAGW